MAKKVSKKYALSINGVVDIDQSGRINVIVEDQGEFDLSILMNDLNGRECKISVNYEEDYAGPDVDTETGEVI
jgi:hypothetical protein